MSKAPSYDAKDLKALEIIEAIQKRPGMYIGGADDDGVFVCASEAIDNALDEAMNGHGKVIRVYIDSKDGTIRVRDEGRGIPVDPHPDYRGKSGLEVVMTVAHSGGKFEAGEYGVTGGLHGTGNKVIVALSMYVVATVLRSGHEHTLNFQQGRVRGKLESVKLPAAQARRTGTDILFALDPARFPDATSTVPPRERLQRALRNKAFLNPEVTFELTYDGKLEKISEPEGIEAFARSVVGDVGLFPKPCSLDNEASAKGETRVQVAFAWAQTAGGSIMGYCNSIHQPDGGTHVQGLQLAFPQVVRAYIAASKMIPVKEGALTIEPRDCWEGVHAIVAIRHREPVFKGQHKGRLANGDAQGSVSKLVTAKFTQWLEENPREARLLCSKVITAAKARVAAAKAKEQVRKTDAGSMGAKGFGKLADCSSRSPEEKEIFLVEGESAGGTGKMGRNRHTQAIYPLKGKPMNTWEKSQASALDNTEISDLTAALGTGLFHEGMGGDEVEAAIGKLRYHKVIFLSDADVDGHHIAVLLLGHFFRHCRPLVERGYVYLGQPPLYFVAEGRKKPTYLKDEAALGAFYAERAAKAGAMLHAEDGRALAGASRMLARKAGEIRRAIEVAAQSCGFKPEDVSHALGAMVGFLKDSGPAELAEAIMELREANGCENVVGAEVIEGVFAVSGLDGDRYFTTVVNDEFVECVRQTTSRLVDIMNPHFGPAVCAAKLVIAGREGPADLLRAARAVEAEASRGTTITRLKGLGEMTADQLGETTLDPALRTLIRVTAEDFDDAGEFLGSMLVTNTRGIEARRELVRATVLSREMIDV